MLSFLLLIKSLFIRVTSLFKKNPKGQVEKAKRSFGQAILESVLAVLAAFEMMPIFLVLAQVFLFALLAGILIVVILGIYLSIVSFFSVTPDVVPPDLTFPVEEETVVTGRKGIKGNKLSWSVEELNVNMANLTPLEQNIYRLGILINQAITGYDTKKRVLDLPTPSIDVDIAMFLGKLSTEQSMVIYPEKDLPNKNVFQHPYMATESNAGFVNFGISKNDTPRNYTSVAGKDVVDALYRLYPSPTGSYSYPANYYPWATFMSVAHIAGKVDYANGFLKNKGELGAHEDRLMKVIEAWGISEKRRMELYTMLYYFLLQAHYHGVSQTEYEHYFNFWCALYYVSGDSDDTRSLYNWELEDLTNKDEDAFPAVPEYKFRKIFIGSEGMNDPKWKHHTELKLGDNSIRMKLNGRVLEEPVWKFIMSESNMSTYPESRRVAMEEAWQELKKMSGYSGNMQTRTLNFHYGFNSFIQGKAIIEILEKKVVPLRSEIVYGGKNPEGNATFTIGGQTYTTRRYYEEVKKSQLPDDAVTIINNLINYFGVSAYEQGEDSKAEALREAYPLESDPYQVPFQRQSANIELYGGQPWSTRRDKNGGWTFSRNGCMIYSVAYVLTAKTRIGINPPETAALMYMTNSLSSGGLLRSGLPTLFGLFGLKVKEVSNIRATSTWDKIDETLLNGGLVIAKFSDPPIASRGSDHFVVINKLIEENGTKKYRMYSSSDVSDSLKLWGREELRKASSAENYVLLVY